MTNKELVRRVSALAQPICQGIGLSLWDVSFEKDGRTFMLTVFIDKDGGVFIEDCEAVSRALDPLLDAPAFDSLPSYTLSVSSAGLERRLTRPEHFQWAVGKKVQLGLYKALDGKNTIVGLLEGRTEEEYRLLSGGQSISVPASLVSSARLYFEM